MNLKLGVYNIAWMRDLFEKDGQPITTGKEEARSRQLADIIRAIDPDFLGIVEGPDTLVSGTKTSTSQLEAWSADFLPEFTFKGIHGFPSPGQQELCALYKPEKLQVLFTPETKAGDRFDEPFLVDTTNRMIKEQYKHYRPPLELSLLTLDGKPWTSDGFRSSFKKAYKKAGLSGIRPTACRSLTGLASRLFL